jgi:hypothetical protein
MDRPVRISHVSLPTIYRAVLTFQASKIADKGNLVTGHTSKLFAAASAERISLRRKTHRPIGANEKPV